MTQATCDVDAINGLLGEMTGDAKPEPEQPKPMPAPVRKKPKAMPAVAADAVGVREVEEGEAEVMLAKPMPVVMAGPCASVPGLPSILEHPAVVAAQVNVDRLTKQLAENAAEVAKLGGDLNVRPDASPADLDRMAAKLLAAGGDTDTSEKFERFETLRRHGKRLGLAFNLAVSELQKARQTAAHELSPQAAQVEFKPAARKAALALLELLRCKIKEDAARDRLRLGGFASPNGTFTGDLLDQWQNNAVIHLVREGHLTREEVKAACPFMEGM